jgi:hypothetical protein
MEKTCDNTLIVSALKKCKAPLGRSRPDNLIRVRAEQSTDCAAA